MSKPSIGEARTLATKHDLERCIVFFTTADGRAGYVSYGKTRALCGGTQLIADAMWDRFNDAVRHEEDREVP